MVWVDREEKNEQCSIRSREQYGGTRGRREIPAVSLETLSHIETAKTLTVFKQTSDHKILLKCRYVGYPLILLQSTEFPVALNSFIQ